MISTLPTAEAQAILDNAGFLHLYGKDDYLYISDIPRRVSSAELQTKRNILTEHGFTHTIHSDRLLLIDLSPERWENILQAYPKATLDSFPNDDTVFPVYALIRLLYKHPSPLHLQPLSPIRTVLKCLNQTACLLALMQPLYQQCAIRLRDHQPLPTALADILYSWLKEQKEEERL